LVLDRPDERSARRTWCRFESIADRAKERLLTSSVKHRAVFRHSIDVFRRSSIMRRCTRLIAPCLLLLFAGSPIPASAVRPFKGNVKATWDNIFLALVAPPAHFEGGGPVTYMGMTTQAGTLVLEPPIAPGVFPGSGSVTITAANGDTVSFDYVGLLFLATGEGVGTFTFTGGTGRFAHVSGQGTFDALIDLSFPDHQPMTVVLDGTISF
jgi:hypothetical protein